MKPVHEQRLERWLGAEKMNRISQNMNGWYGAPINLRDVPGSVWVDKDGNFVGEFGRGYMASALDHLESYWQNLWRETGRSPVMAAGFASIGDALSRASQGYSQNINGNIQKSGGTGVIAASNTLWRLGATPAAGAAGSAAPGGRAPDKTTTGAMVFNNPASGTLRLVGADMAASVVNNCLLLYDRIFDVAKTINSTATEAVTGVPTRYQSTTTTAEDYIGGNFLFMETGATAMAATAHNWTVCQYTDDGGNTAQTLPSLAGISGCIADRLDMPLNTWFAPLASGDVGIKALSQMQCSALVATGSINFVIGHPIGFMTLPVVNMMMPFDWLTNRNQAPRIFNDACLALLEMPKPVTTATVYTGMIYATNAS